MSNRLVVELLNAKVQKVKVLTDTVQLQISVPIDDESNDYIRELVSLNRRPISGTLQFSPQEGIPVRLRARIMAYFHEYGKLHDLRKKEIELVRHDLMMEFCSKANVEPFSLSDCSKEIAERFNDYCLVWAAVYNCLPNAPHALVCNVNTLSYLSYVANCCGICGRPADGGEHHLDVRGIGGVKDDSNMRVMKLCYDHHIEDAHGQGVNLFIQRFGLERMTILKRELPGWVI